MWRKRGLLAVLGILLSLGAGDGVARSQTPSQPGIEVRTIDGLKQRRLFELAAGYGLRLLDRDDLPGRKRVDIAVAVLDTLTQQAFQGRDLDLWKEAREVAGRLQDEVDSPRQILIRVQAALIDQARIEQAVLEIESDMAAAGTRQRTLGEISGVVEKFDILQKEINGLLNRRPRPGQQAEWFSPHELLALRYNVEYQQARALLHRASLYGDEEEVNRNDALALVEEQMQLVLQSVGPEEPLWWTVQGDRILAARSAKNFRLASSIIAGLPESAGDERSRDRLTAEWIRTLVEMRRFDDALALAGKGTLASRSPHLDLARIELFVALSGREKDEAWQTRALELTGGMEAKHGGYWARLANLLVVGTAASTPRAGSNLDLLVRVADEAQRKKQWQEAIQALDAAAEKATETNQQAIAFRLGFRAAAIEQQNGRFAEAAGRFEQLAIAFRELPEAHSASLMACWSFAKVIDNDPQRLTRYETMLERLIEFWPESSSADQARLWLAMVRQGQQNWPAAASLLLNVNAASPLFENAVRQLRSVLEGLAFRPDATTEMESAIARASIQRLAPLLEADSPLAADNRAETRQQIVLQLAELRYGYGLDVPGDLTGELDQLIQGGAASGEELASALALRYVAAAGEANAPADTRVFSSFAAGPAQLEILLRGLTRESGSPPGNTRSKMLISAANRFATEISALPVADRKKWGQARIDALVQTAAIPEAIAVARQLVTQFPRDADFQIRLATLLTEAASGDPAHRQDALRQWRLVARFSPQHSENWFQARYFVAKLNAAAGNREDALKLLRFIKAVPPGWSKAANAAEFDELYRSLGGQ